ncbi:Bacterial extracellular solute-binding protein, family 3 [compost metagenome]
MAAIAAKNPAKVPTLKVKLKDSPVYIGLAKNEPALLQKVNAIITEAKADGSLNRNAEKWLKQPLPADL